MNTREKLWSLDRIWFKNQFHDLLILRLLDQTLQFLKLHQFDLKDANN